MKEIPLTRGKVALVDDEDYEALSGHKWCAWRASENRTFYAARRIKKRSVAMHRVILSLEQGDSAVDHKNGDGLDNRKTNLRLATPSQNNMNKLGRRGSTSKYKGVSLCGGGSKKWRARIKHDSLGRFENEVEAALAYDEKAQQIFGEFAKLNFGKEKRGAL